VKAAEIVVGQDYACGTTGSWGTYRRCRVIELGKHKVLADSDKVVPAARIRFEDDSSGFSQWVVLRSIVMLWAEHEVEIKARNKVKEAHAQHGPKNAERARHAIKHLADAGFVTGTPSFELAGEVASGFVRVKVEFLEAIVKALV
jgi:hypothetical protein